MKLSVPDTRELCQIVKDSGGASEFRQNTTGKKRMRAQIPPPPLSIGESQPFIYWAPIVPEVAAVPDLIGTAAIP